MGLGDNEDSPRMSYVGSGRGLQFVLYRQFMTALVQVSSIAGGDAVVIDSFTIDPHQVDDGMTEEQFAAVCAEWSCNVNDDALRQLREQAGAYPLIRSRWDGDRFMVSVVVPGIGAAAGIVRIAEKTAGPDLVEVERTEGQRTGEGIEYGFVFERFEERNAALGVTVEDVNPKEFRCVGSRHQKADVPAAVRVTVPVPGVRERVSVTVCQPCLAGAIVDGLGLDSDGIDID